MKGEDYLDFRNELRSKIFRNFEVQENKLIPCIKDPLSIEVINDIILNADMLIDSFPLNFAKETGLKNKLEEIINTVIVGLFAAEQCRKPKKGKIIKIINEDNREINTDDYPEIKKLVDALESYDKDY